MSLEGSALESSLVNVACMLHYMGGATHKLVPLNLQNYFQITACVLPSQGYQVTGSHVSWLPIRSFIKHQL